MSDGSFTSFGEESRESFEEKCEGKNVSGKLEQSLYQQVREMLSKEENRKNIEKEFPKASIPRRNTGYAIDLLKDSKAFGNYDKEFNFCELNL